MTVARRGAGAKKKNGLWFRAGLSSQFLFLPGRTSRINGFQRVLLLKGTAVWMQMEQSSAFAASVRSRAPCKLQGPKRAFCFCFRFGFGTVFTHFL